MVIKSAPAAHVVLLTLGFGLLVVWIPLGILTLWFIYRIVVGWRALSNNQPMYV